MSLFPAYKPVTPRGEDHKEINNVLKSDQSFNRTDLSWLTNSSFAGSSVGALKESEPEKEHERKDKPPAESFSKTDSSKSSHSHKKKRKKEKDKKNKSRNRSDHHQKHSSTPKIFESDPFYEDKKQERGNFLVDRLYRPVIPKYNKYTRFFKKYNYLVKKYKKAKKTHRYFVLSCRRREDEAEEFNNDPSSREEELTKITEDFNRRLAENPNDEGCWLEYVHFQDTVYEFEKAFRKNPVGGDKVTTERKLAILERAVEKNPASECLLSERFELSEHVRPSEQLAEECTRALIQDPGNLTLWRSLVRTSRNNMARCTVPGVLQLFSKAITRVSQLRLHRLTVSVEQDVISLLVDCGLFLQQAGLWEQLWTLLQMYLSLSLTSSGQFDVPFSLEEGLIREQENTVLGTGLPLSTLWLRVEKLRTQCHFLPNTLADDDPQRVVFSDDMAGLLQPVMSAELQLRLVISILVLLKVPLLPTRQSLLHCLGLLDSVSAVSNIETLLPAVCPLGAPPLQESTYLAGALDLASEPQYLKEQLGRQEFMDWVTGVMQRCTDLLPTTEAILVQAWQLRLYGLLCRLRCLGLTWVSDCAKQAQKHAKQLLKLPRYSDNLLLYTEYAMIVRDSGDLDKACKVLETVAALPRPMASEPDACHVHLCRRLVECLLHRDYILEREHAVRVLTMLISSQPGSVTAAHWHQQTSVLIERYAAQAEQTLTPVQAMVPQLLVEWLACHALQLSTTQSVWEATALLQTHIDNTSRKAHTLGSLWVEQLYEVLIDILYQHTVHTHTSYTVLRETLAKALALFPNNLSLLGTLANIETGTGGGGTPLWKLVTLFPSSSPLARLLLIFVVRCRVSHLNTVEGEPSGSGTHYLKNLLRHLTQEKTTRECPLVWRLYLQLVAATDEPAQVKAVFYKCLQACPWVKSFYLDAVKFMPEELPEVQDLLIEKELRLHITPEELEILRD